METASTFLYRLQPTRPAMLTDGPTPEEAQLVADHFAYLQRLLAQGTLVLAGRTLNVDPSSFGLVIFQAPSLAEAQAIMLADPAVAGRVMHAELYPYRIALHAATAPGGEA